MSSVQVRENRRSPGDHLEAGHDLVAAGYIGSRGVREILSMRREELLDWFRPGYLDQIAARRDVILEGSQERWTGVGAADWIEVREGGVLAALWDFLEPNRLGARIFLREIPVRQETVEICERYALNPYRLLSDNCLLLASRSGYDLALRLQDEGVIARVIGKVEPGPGRIIDHEDGVGFLNRPAPDELGKVKK